MSVRLLANEIVCRSANRFLKRPSNLLCIRVAKDYRSWKINMKLFSAIQSIRVPLYLCIYMTLYVFKSISYIISK